MKLRTGLLLGAAFAAGVAAGPDIGGLVWHRGGSLTAALMASARADEAGQANAHAETYRLLTLFGDVFERVRADYVEPVTDRTLIDNALDGMLSGLDPHSAYMTEKQYADMQVQTRGEFGGLGLEVTGESGLIKVITPMDGTPAAHAGMKPGDLILSVNQKSTDGMSLNDAVDKMRGPPGSTITLGIKRPGVAKPFDVSLKREIIHLETIKSALYGKVGYIRIAQFDEETDSGLRAAYAKLSKQAGGSLSGLVLDLRNDPGGLLEQAVDVCDDFITSGEVVSTRSRHPQDSERMNAHGADITDGAPILVLINQGTASASEIVSGALQDHQRSVTLGQRSFGKGSVQTLIPFPGHGAIRLTTARYYTPSGRSIQGLGITPDIKVQESRDDLARFLPRESNLDHTITNQGGTGVAPPRADLPAIAKTIPEKPPANWPAFDPTKPSTDFQLQQGLKVIHAMIAERQHAGP
ncbi:S41 family peptidase [Lichenicoccus sp.]|uniref:S41 family peptidase n=1 Tax=Lichenicoccus sp. TaxID=2781899 RepID=UPI003D0987D6